MKILAVQNRMGIGDMIIFLPFIEAIFAKTVPQLPPPKIAISLFIMN